jgi:hypothetical protein
MKAAGRKTTKGLEKRRLGKSKMWRNLRFKENTSMIVVEYQSHSRGNESREVERRLEK